MSGSEPGRADAIVVGSGVSGLTTAVVLAEAGLSVAVVAEKAWPDTTSRVAGAVWEPYLSGGDDVGAWAAATYRVLSDLAGRGVAGVRVDELVEGGPDPIVIPDWALAADGIRALRPDELRAGWVGGFCCLVPIVDMSRYLPYLASRLAHAGGTIEIRPVDRLADLAPASIVVNCSGLGAVSLAADPSLRPVRGQVVVVANPGLAGAAIVAGDGPHTTYRIAHSEEVVVGGTADTDEWDLSADADVAAAILTRAAAIDPELAGAQVIGHRVGLRPWRPTVRVAVDADPPAGIGRLVHNYGHGGSGLSLSWGCASAVAGLTGAVGAEPPPA